MDKVKTKQKVFGLKGSEYEGLDYCNAEEPVSIGEYKSEKEVKSKEDCES